MPTATSIPTGSTRVRMEPARKCEATIGCM
jgi:hypothetical protein